MKKRILCAGLVLSLLLSVGGFPAALEEEHEHIWVEDAKHSIAPSCGVDGMTAYTCAVEGCEETKSELALATGAHTYGGNAVCDVCGYIDMSALESAAAIAAYGFYHDDADGSKTYTLGDKVLFGSYPQSRVTDAELLERLETSAGEWLSYGYYDALQPSDYARYCDVELDGSRYRGVYMEAYRPYYANLPADAAYSYIDEQGFELNTAYWFAYEPIAWNVLGWQDGRLLLNATKALEAQPYQALYTGGSAENIAGLDGLALNDWESSAVRAFLNDTFYNAAFTAAEKALIPTVTLDNSNTGFGNNAFQIDQNPTEDRVFLLSYKDMNNADYGFLSASNARSRSFTAYALSQGLRPSGEGATADGEPACYYMLRSAGANSYTVSGVSKKGTLSYEAKPFSIGDSESHDGFAINGDFGVLPSVYLKIAPVTWEEGEVSYQHRSGAEAALSYALCFPKAYRADGEALPLIVYIPDATYRSRGIGKVEQAEMPTNWVTEEMLDKHPAVYLVLTLTKYSYTDSGAGNYLDGLADEGSEEAQVVKLIDAVCAQYNIDPDRVYLTGQSMGGIFDWALNESFPDRFAATVYVACQPGGEVSTPEAPVAMYDTILADAAFANQRFVYIASRLDPKASVGQDDIEQALIARGQAEGADYLKLYTLDPENPEGSTEALASLFTDGIDRYFLAFPQVADGSMQEHMASFSLAYQIEGILDWLLQQSR